MDTTILTTLPLLSGVYLFKDSTNAIIYVGKAKVIKNASVHILKNRNVIGK